MIGAEKGKKAVVAPYRAYRPAETKAVAVNLDFLEGLSAPEAYEKYICYIYDLLLKNVGHESAVEQAIHVATERIRLALHQSVKVNALRALRSETSRFAKECGQHEVSTVVRVLDPLISAAPEVPNVFRPFIEKMALDFSSYGFNAPAQTESPHETSKVLQDESQEEENSANNAEAPQVASIPIPLDDAGCRVTPDDKPEEPVREFQEEAARENFQSGDRSSIFPQIQKVLKPVKVVAKVSAAAKSSGNAQPNLGAKPRYPTPVRKIAPFKHKDSRELADNASDKRPLTRVKDAAATMPVEALGEELASVARAAASLTHTAISMAVQALLAVLALVLQAHADVFVDGRRMPISLYFITIAASGERKTTLDRLLLRGVREYEKLLRARYDKDLLKFENAKAVYDAARKQALRLKTQCERLQALAVLGSPPKPPKLPVILVGDFTVEGLINALKHSLGSCGAFLDEGGNLLGGFSMAAGKKIRTFALLSSLWDGIAASVVRAGKPIEQIFGVRLTLHLQLQKEMGIEFISNRAAQDQGFLGRPLMLEPERKMGDRPYAQPDPDDLDVIANFASTVCELLQRPLAAEESGGLSPRTVTLSPGAMVVYRDFYNRVEAELGPNGKFSDIPSFGSKAGEHALRLACLLALFENIETLEISERWMLAAVELIGFYLVEARRLATAGPADQYLELAEKVLGWIRHHGDVIDIVTLYQKGPVAIRSASRARAVMATLIEHGHVRQLPEDVAKRLTGRCEAYKLT